jgi:hypothetical protein
MDELTEMPFGIPTFFFHSLKSESDWAVVIKLHAALEAALNRLITFHLKDERLSDAVAFMETNDRRSGKMAFVNALNLLPTDTKRFIAVFSNLRNLLVHDIANINFQFAEHVAKFDQQKRKNWRESLLPMFAEHVKVENKMIAREALILEMPRTAVIGAAISVIARIVDCIIIRKDESPDEREGHATVQIQQIPAL